MAIITIGGNLGAGKTTLAAKLATKLDYEQLYMGGIFRAMAAEKGMTIEEFYAALKSDPSLERSVDDRQATLIQTKDNLVIQGRVAWYFAKNSSFKVINILLIVDPTIGAKRVAERPENLGKSIKEVAIATTLRAQNERERYKALYNIDDYFAPEHYGIILDTTNLNEEEVFQKVMSQLEV